jgi:hypothetical protein
MTVTAYDTTFTIPLTEISPNAWNPHRMTDEELKALEQSILDSGQWRPILVVEMDDADETDPSPQSEYRIVDGEHLWRALSSLYTQGLSSDQARVMILGKNSEIPIWKQQEIGQTINHGLRGSIEDPEKTRRITLEILKHRKIEVVARRMNMGVEGVRHLTQAPEVRRGVPQIAPTMKGSVRTRNLERKSLHVALVFDNATELEHFEKNLRRVGEELGLFAQHYQNRAGRYRIEVLTRLLEQALAEV